jgi:hypothetical protein
MVDPLFYPGGTPNLMEAVDADLLARTIAWAGEAAAARDQAFNITNGDVFLWPSGWPAIADALGMQPGGNAPLSLAREMPSREQDWERIRAKYRLVSPALADFVGLSFQYADSCFGYDDERGEIQHSFQRSSSARPGFTNSSIPKLCCESGSEFSRKNGTFRRSSGL